jgi:hypothetical protein
MRGAGSVAPTPATSDNSNRIATTAYVQAQTGIGTPGINQLTGDVTAGPGAGSVAATIAANAVVTAKIADANVTTAKIADVNVTTGKLANNAVTPAKLAFGHGAQTAATGAATLNQGSGVITTEALVAATTYTLTLTNSLIVATSTVIAIASDATGAVVPPTVTSIVEGSATVTIVFAMLALTGTFKIRFAVFN